MPVTTKALGGRLRRVRRTNFPRKSFTDLELKAALDDGMRAGMNPEHSGMCPQLYMPTNGDTSRYDRYMLGLKMAREANKAAK